MPEKETALHHVQTTQIDQSRNSVSIYTSCHFASRGTNTTPGKTIELGNCPINSFILSPCIGQSKHPIAMTPMRGPHPATPAMS